jgi:arylsulfatase A-like enzyme
MNPREPITAWDKSEGYRADTTTRPVWRNRGDGQPFFIVINTMRTHESRVWPDSTEPAITDPRAVSVPPYYPDTPTVRSDLARHYDNIARMDEWVGQILDLLDQDGLAESTVVFFWSDHGDGLPRAKRWLYDSGLRVPLIIRWPGQIEPGSVDSTLVSFLDLAPTVLSIANVDIPIHLQGRIIAGNRAEPPPEFLFGARDRIDGSYDRVRSVRNRHFKYIRNYYPEKPYILYVPYRDRMPTMQELLKLKEDNTASGPVGLWLRDSRPPEELYDTSTDPHEVENLAFKPAYTEIRQTMGAALDEWELETGDLGSIPESELVERMWPNGEQPVTAPPEFIFRGDRLVIRCVTEGASAAYATNDRNEAHWLLYTHPLNPSSGSTLRARCIRYGFKASPEATMSF